MFYDPPVESKYASCCASEGIKISVRTIISAAVQSYSSHSVSCAMQTSSSTRISYHPSLRLYANFMPKFAVTTSRLSVEAVHQHHRLRWKSACLSRQGRNGARVFSVPQHGYAAVPKKFYVVISSKESCTSFSARNWRHVRFRNDRHGR